MRRKKWSNDEVQQLKNLYMSKNLTRKEIAYILHRSEGSVKKKITELGLKKTKDMIKQNISKISCEEWEKRKNEIEEYNSIENYRKRLRDKILHLTNLKDKKPTRKEFCLYYIEYNYQRLLREIRDFNIDTNLFRSDNTSNLEEFFEKILQQHKINYVKNSYPFGRKIGQCDFLLVDLNIGVEINDFATHNSNFSENNLLAHKDKTYHFNKTKNFYDNGIKLYHLFEDELFDKNFNIQNILSIVDKNPIFNIPNKHVIKYKNLEVIYYDDGVIWT